SDTETTKELEDIQSAYKTLGDRIWEIIEKSMTIAKDEPELLKSAVQIIVQEEEQDQKYLAEKETSGKIQESRPRQWKKNWMSVIKQSLTNGMNEAPSVSLANKTSSLCQCFLNIGKRIKNDLNTVETHVKHCYPEEFDICNIYAKFFHDFLSDQLKAVTEFHLQKKDNHFILCFVQNIYPSDIIKNPALMKDLGSLMPREKIERIEKDYISSEQSDINTWMKKSLEVETAKWIKGKEPEKLDGCYHSELPIDIVQKNPNFFCVINHLCIKNVEGGKNRAQEITPELGQKVLELLLLEMPNILESFKKSLDNFAEKYMQQLNFRAVIIANINSCLLFRDYIQKQGAFNVTAKEKSLSILNEIEKTGFNILLSNLLLEIKHQYKTTAKEKWFSCSEILIEKIKQYLLEFKTLRQSYFQELLKQVHCAVVTEYIKRLLKKKISYKTQKKQQEIAEEIIKNALQIQDFFAHYESLATWLDQVLPKFAEIIKLQDKGAIQLEVAALARDFPDISKHHISALLHMKGNLTKNEEKDILNILKVNT
uniref:TNF alpha induced protein 2 n=1 Tax=Latimeria chalumnae TaxID=7897 RepID=H3AYP9_LATCH